MVLVLANRVPASSLSVTNVSSFELGELSSGTSPSAMAIFTENKNVSRCVFSGTGGADERMTSAILSASIWLYMLSRSFRAASTLLSLTHDSGRKLNGSTRFSPVIAIWRAFSSHAEDFCGCR